MTRTKTIDPINLFAIYKDNFDRLTKALNVFSLAFQFWQPNHHPVQVEFLVLYFWLF